MLFLVARRISDSTVRKHWERAWRSHLSPDPGLSVARMMMEAEKGNLKALYVMGENPVRALPGSPRVSGAMKNLEFLVVQDILETETTRFADVVLPGAAFSEKGGSFTNMEGRIQSFEPAIPLPGEAKPDWEILDLLGKRMGSTDQYRSIQHIRFEIASLVPGYMDLARSQGTAWVRETSRSRLFSVSPPIHLFFLKARMKVILIRRSWVLRDATWVLEPGQHTQLASGITPLSGSMPFEGDVEMSLEDGRSLGIQEGETVTIASPYGAIRRRIVLTAGIAPGLLYVPRAVHGNDAASLVPFVIPGGVDTPGTNVVPVKIERGPSL